MEKSWLIDLGISDENAKKIFTEYGKNVQSEIERRKTAEEKIKDLTEKLEKCQSELVQFSEISSEQENFKEKFEKLTAEINAEREELARQTAERNKVENIRSRFDAVADGKNWTHEAVKLDYLTKFRTAIEDEGNAGKSDIDIFNDLTKDDKQAFSVHEVIKLAGGNPSVTTGSGKALSREEIFAIKDANERQAEILNNLDLFPELTAEKQ